MGMDFTGLAIRAAKAAIGAVVAFFLGLHIMIQMLCYAIAFDIATGLIAGWATKTLDSGISRQGISRKVLVLLGVAAAEIMGRTLGAEVTAPWGGTWGLGAAVAGYYCIHEALSITENLARAGVPLPVALVARLHQLKRAVEEEK